MMKIELLDYIQDMEDNFWIVRTLQNGKCYGYPVYPVSDTGTKYNYITGKYYVKASEAMAEIPREYKRIFKPREFYKENKEKLEGIWRAYVDVLNEIGIEDKDIGIFGSYLVGFAITKDVDFVIYGKENLYKYYKNIDFIKKKLAVTSITPYHAEYQYNKHKDRFPSSCDLREIVKRNWSGIELPNGVLSTPRFIDVNNQELPKRNGIDKKVIVEVLEGIETAMLPRVAKVLYNGEEYKVLSNVWKFQSFAHVGDILELFGNVNDEERTILLDDTCYSIQYIEKTNILLPEIEEETKFELREASEMAMFSPTRVLS